MRMKHMQNVGRLVAALGAVGILQACASMPDVRVPMLQNENSSANRSMLSLYNPLPFQHRSVSDGMFLKAPQDRNPKYIYLGY
jgi:hypothetical protein